MLVFWLLLRSVLGDIPVNCNYLQILGSWTLHLNPETFTASLFDPQSTCGHGQPGRISAIPLGEDWSFPTEEHVRVSFIEPNFVASQMWGGGSWTMVANEGFLMKFQKVTLFLQSMYTQDMRNGDIYSDCGKTMIGWYGPSDPTDHSNWGCLYGIKDGSGNTRTLLQPGGKFWVSPTAFIQSSAPKNYEEHHDLVSFINRCDASRAQTGWKAGFSEYFVGMSMAEVNSRVGVKRKASNERREDAFQPYTSLLQTGESSNMSAEKRSLLSRTDKEALTAFLSTPAEEIPLDALPEEWDWSNVGGRSYVSNRVINQGECGSCYAISTIEMLESRLKVISQKNRDVRLSLQHLVSCNFYTEGCHGGFPILSLKFISEFGIPTDSCLPYSARDDNCADVCDEADFWVTVDSYGYLGGYYGAGTEELMMRELRARGPFAVSFEPGYQFAYYVGGIYQEAAYREDGDETMRDVNVPWEQVDHSVLLVGWGEENGIPYWKILNSWGKGWGEDGYFRMRRYRDESGIGSMGEIAVPRVIQKPIE